MAATDRLRHPLWHLICLALLALCSATARAAVLPEDRADLLYHSYSGGGITIEGPALLVRKGFKDTVSVYAKAYQDLITSASIDVVTSGSRYTEERNEYSVGMDFLVDRAMFSLGYTNSREPDYIGETVSFDISQDFFGDMTTLALGFSLSNDQVGRRQAIDDDEEAVVHDLKRRRYRVGLTQVLTRNWLVSLRGESILDEGYLTNYHAAMNRTVHYLDNGNFGTQAENLPDTRSSDAASITSLYYLPYRATLRLEGRYFSDSWGIRARNFELRYTHPIRDKLTLELKGRVYAQTGSEYFSDLFDYQNQFTYMTRNKELSRFKSQNFGLGITYDFDYRLPLAKRQSLSLFWDFILFDYADFRNAELSGYRPLDGVSGGPYAIGEEPTYSFDANVIRAFFSVFY